MAAEQQVADMEAAANIAGDAAAFENGVLRRQVADLRKAAQAERQVPYAVLLATASLLGKRTCATCTLLISMTSYCKCKCAASSAVLMQDQT